MLDYYEIEGARERRGGAWTLRPARPARFEQMALAATETGRRTLVAGDRRVPLYGGGRRAPAAGGGAMTSAPVADPKTEEQLLEEFEAERPGRRLHGVAAVVVNVLGAGLVAVRDLLGLQSDPGAGVPARVPRRRAAADLPGLPRAGAREPRRAPRGEPVAARLDPRHPRARRGRLRGGQRRRAVPPRRRSHGLDIVAGVVDASRWSWRPRGGPSAGSCPRSASASSPTPTSAA